MKESRRVESLTSRYPNNLPLQLNSFIGRERELEQLRKLFWTTRLLTLTGPGGCGKTRLALKVAEGMLDAFENGVWLVDLAPLPESGPVSQAVAAVFSIQEPVGGSFTDALVDFLRPREVLLVLDNCEHLLPACVELGTVLLRACPNLFILATSRESFNMDGEISWQIPPLANLEASSDIQVSALSQVEAPRLFLERAAAAQPGFAPSTANAPAIAQICRRLDGLPLAIELAAARVNALSVEQIASRLDDRFDLLKLGRRGAAARHQTLRALIDWSYGLLAPSEKELFRRLAVFAGGWSLGAAEALSAQSGTAEGSSEAPAGILDVLTRLVDKSMVIADQTHAEPRYRFLETIRQYAREKLAQSAEAEKVSNRHLEYFIEWAEQANPGLFGQHQLTALEIFEREHENIRAAIDWGLENASRVGLAQRLANASARFLRLRGYLSEGRRYLSEALNREQPAQKTESRARGLVWLANLAYLQSDFPTMHRLLEESLTIWRELDLTRSTGNAAALEMLGELMTEEGDYGAAQALFSESLEIFRKNKDQFGIGEVLMQFGWAAIRTGDYQRAKAWLEEFLGLARSTRYVTHIAFALSGLGELAIRQSEYDRSVSLLEESLALRRAHGDKWGVGTTLGSLGWVSLRQGDDRRMRRFLQESIAVRMEIGDKSGIAWCLEKLAEGALLHARSQPARAPKRERLLLAARVFGAAAAIPAPLNSVIDPADQPDYEKILADLRHVLGKTSFSAAWLEGEQWISQVQGLDHAISQALAGPDGDDLAFEPLAGSSKGKPGGLSRREREVASLIVQGKSNREIADTLTVDIKTVEAHIAHIFNKLGFDSRVQIATWAMEKGLATPVTERPSRE